MTADAMDVARHVPAALQPQVDFTEGDGVARHGGGERLRALLASETAALAVLDAAGRIAMANRSFAALPRQGRGALVGLEPAALFVADDAAAVAGAVAAALAGRAAPVFEARLLSGAADPDAAVEVACRPLREEAGALLRLADVTERRHLRAQLAAASRLQAVGQLAGGIAHDFNNLLATITGAAEAALEAAPGGAGAAELRQILDGAERGARLVRQLLAFAAAQPLQPRVMRLDDAVRAAEPLLRRLLGPRHRLAMTLDKDAPPVRIDPAQLDQVLLNLVANAANAMPDGGTLRIAVRARRIAHGLRAVAGIVPPGDWVVLGVADQGRGIPAALRERVFDPFFSTRRGQGGTGLGLSTVLGVIRQSGGHLTLWSREGVGTRFRLWFPPTDEAVAVAAAPAAPVPGPGPAAPRRVLLVEDEAPLRRLTRRALEAAGYDVTDAADAEDALAAAEGAVPDLLVSDINLGGDDGLDLAAALRARHSAIRALMISGYAEGMVGRDLRAEGLHFLAKPFRTAELLEAVRRALG